MVIRENGGPKGIRTPDCALGKRCYIRFNYGTFSFAKHYNNLILLIKIIPGVYVD